MTNVEKSVLGGASGELVPNVRLHDLRHTDAALLLAQGVPARVLVELPGHSHIGITMKLYRQSDSGSGRPAPRRRRVRPVAGRLEHAQKF